MKKEINHKRTLLRYSFAFLMLVAGLVLSYMNIGKEFLGFSSIGYWLIYVSFIMIAILTLQLFSNKKRIVDERMQFIAMKAARVTFTSLILFSFFIMILDGIKTITIPYSYFMSYLICGIMAVYFISYKLLLRYN